VFRVVSTNGDTFLGGEDFDARVIDWLVDGFKSEHGIDLRKDRMALQRLKDAAEKAKIELSSVREVEINLPFIISSGRNEALHLQRVLTRPEFEKLTGDLVERTVEIVRQTLEDAGLSRDEVEDVVLVGGMTRMPRVERAVAEFFGREPSKGVHPDEVVAVGAGIQGAALGEEATLQNKVVLLDVTPQTLGMMVAGGLFEPLIPKDTTVPTMRTKSFTTSRDNQTAVKILVMQGENDQADKNELLGEFILTGLRRAGAGAVEIEVTFEINADGIVSVHAKDLETGKEQSITVTATSGLTQDELRDMIDAGEQYAVERKRDEEFESKKQEAEGLIHEIERLFDKVAKVVGGSDYGRDALEKAHGVIDRTRIALDRHDTAAIKEQVDALSRTLRMFKGVVQKG
jgi:molecular chaperone DnaK